MVGVSIFPGDLGFLALLTRAIAHVEDDHGYDRDGIHALPHP
jgi:hypothetical protein